MYKKFVVGVFAGALAWGALPNAVIAGAETQASQSDMGLPGLLTSGSALGLPPSSPASVTYHSNAQVQIIVELDDAPALYMMRHRPSSPSGRQRDTRAFAASHRQLSQRQHQLVDELRRRRLIAPAARRFTRVANAIVTSAKASEIAKIAAQPGVKGVSLDRKVRALVTDNVVQVGAPSVWAMLDSGGSALTGKGITIAVIDSGIDYTHPDLGGCFGPGCKVRGGYDFVNEDGDPMDDYYHGTLVAGVAAANGVLKGVAPDASLYAFKVLGADGGGYTSDVIAALETAVDPDGDPSTDDAVDVINLSLGIVGDNTSTMSEAANTAMQAGIVVVASVGNGGPGLNTIEAPGSAQDVITVGAVDSYGVVPYFSARGMFAAGLDLSTASVKPELLAPGVSIQTTEPGGGYRYSGGTSLAAPHVAGAAALMRQLHPQLSSAEIKSLLVNYAAPVSGDATAVGNGQLDVLAAAKGLFIVSPATLYMGYFGGGTTGKNAVLTVKNLGRGAEVSAVDSGQFPAGASLIPTSAQFSLNAYSSSAQSVWLNVDTARVSYPADLRSPYSSVLNFSANGATARVPVAFHRAELLEIRESQTPGNYWSYAATVFDAVEEQSAELASYESGDPVLRIALRDKPVNIIFSADHHSTIHAIENVSASDSPLEFPSGELGFGVIAPLTGEGRALEFVEQVFELTHPDNPDFRYRRAFGGDRNMYTIRNLSNNFRLDYFALAEEVDSHPQDRQLYVLKRRQQGLFADLVFDLSGYGSAQMLVNNALWRDQGYRLAFAPASYRPDGETYWDATVEALVRTDATLLTLHGLEQDLTGWPTFLNIGVSAGDALTLGNSFEISIAGDSYHKLRRSNSDELPVAIILEQQASPMRLGQGLRFWATQLRSDNDSLVLAPDVNGDASRSSVMDSWGNSYWQGINYVASCADTDSQVASGAVEDARLFTNSTGCSEIHATFEYPTYIDGKEYLSTAELQLSAVDQASTPRIAMLQLLDEGVVSSYVGGGGELLIALDDSQPIAGLSLELALDGGAWQTLRTELVDKHYRAAIPAVNGVATADLRLSVTAQSGNRIVNTIRGAFVVGDAASSTVDSDSDGSVDAEDAAPLNPRYSLAEGEPVLFSSNAPSTTSAIWGQENVVVHAFSLETAIDSELSTLTLEAFGAGDDSSDVVAARLYLDRDRDSQLDTGDTLLSSTRFGEDNGTAIFLISQPGPLDLPAGKTHFIVSYDFAP